MSQKSHNQKIAEIRARHAVSAMRDNPNRNDQRLFDAATNADADRNTLLLVCEELLSEAVHERDKWHKLCDRIIQERNTEQRQKVEISLELREAEKRLQQVCVQRDNIRHIIDSYKGTDQSAVIVIGRIQDEMERK